MFNFRLNTHLKFTVHGRKQASKQASTYVNTLPQCSPASVGLTQAHPNKPTNVTNTVHSYAPNDMHKFSFGTVIRLKKNNTKKNIYII